MTGPQRREQLIDVGRKLFADKGFEGTTVEEIAAKAGVSKPVVYEHFGGKEGLYAVVVDREIRTLLDGITGALRPRRTPGCCSSGRRWRCSTTSRAPPTGSASSSATRPPGSPPARSPALISDVASQVEHLLAAEFKRAGSTPRRRRSTPRCSSAWSP